MDHLIINGRFAPETWYHTSKKNLAGYPNIEFMTLRAETYVIITYPHGGKGKKDFESYVRYFVTICTLIYWKMYVVSSHFTVRSIKYF